MIKQEIRNRMKELKRELPKSQIQLLSEIITNKFLQTEAYIKCDVLFCYLSFNQEILTSSILQSAFKQKKKVAVPKIIGNEMKFIYIDSMENLVPGALGILEPISEVEEVPMKSFDYLVVVPGLAFDLHKNRIGYGKGYYDGFFEKYSDIPMKKIAMAYDFQIIPELPVEGHDKKVDQIITETRVIE